MAENAWESRHLAGRGFGLAALIVAAGGLLEGVRAEPALTEVTALARAYGAGVHAYFSGDAQRAYDDLTQAIEAGTSDPRAWYFRGLAALKLGRLDEAEADFSTASTRETEATGDWAVSRSLERVQGHDRLALERHRVRARVAGYEQRRQAVERRYSQIESRQTEMLRQRRPVGIAPDAAEKFGGEDVTGTPVPPASVEEVGTPAATDGVREPASEEQPIQPEVDPEMKDENPPPEAPPAPAAEADAAPAEVAPAAADPAMDTEDAAAAEDAPAAPSDAAEEPMAEEAASGESPPADALDGDVLGN